MTERKSKTAKRKQTEAARAALAKKRAASKPAASKPRKQKTDSQRQKHNEAAKKSYQRGKAECGDAIARTKAHSHRYGIEIFPKKPYYLESKKYKNVSMMPETKIDHKRRLLGQ